MLDSLERYVLLFDLKLRTARKEVEFPSLTEIAPAIKARVDDSKSTIKLPAYKGTDLCPWLRIKRARIDTIGGSQFLRLLFSVGDPRAANPSFEHSETAALRTVEKLEKEGKALTAHCSIALTEATGKRYRLIVEDVRGLGRTRMQDLLANEFKAISRDFDLGYTNNAGQDIETYIIPELQGIRSEKIKDSLNRGTITGVYLVDTRTNTQLDEGLNARVARRELKIEVSDSSLLDRISAWGRERDFDRLRVIWNDPEGAGKPERASVDITQSDVQDTYFVKQHKIKVSTPLDEASEELRDDLLQAMHSQIT